MRETLPIHGQLDHRCNGPDPIPVLVHVLCFALDEPVETGDAAGWFTVTPDVGGARLRRIAASVYEAGASDLEVQIHNLETTDDQLASPCVVPAGLTDSFATLFETIDTGSPPANLAPVGTRYRIDVDADGGCSGLVVHLEFGPEIIRLT